MLRHLALLFFALLALPLASCDSVTGQGENDDGGGDVIINPPVITPQLNVALGTTSKAVPGQNGVGITVLVSNEGPGAANGVVVNVSFPHAITNGFYAPEGTACRGDREDDYCSTGEVLEWAVGTIPEGSTRAFSFMLPFNVYVNGSGSVSVSANGTNTRAGSASVLLANDSNQPVQMGLSGSQGLVSPGSEVSFTATYIATRDLSSSRLGVEVPAGMEFVSASGGGLLSDGLVVWDLGTLPANQAGQQSVRLRVASTRKPGQSVTIRSEIAEGSMSRVGAQAAIAVPKSGGLQVSLTPSTLAMSYRSSVTVTVQVQNTSGARADDVLLLMAYPKTANGFYAPAGTSCKGDRDDGYCNAGETLEWKIGPMQPNESKTLTVSLTPNVYSGGSYLFPFAASADATSGSGGAAVASVVLTE